MIASKAATKSVKIWSTWSSPARTAMMSELGFVYFLGSTAEKKVVRVCNRGQETFQRRVDSYDSGASRCDAHPMHAGLQALLLS